MNLKVGRAVLSPPGRGAVRTPRPTSWGFMAPIHVRLLDHGLVRTRCLPVEEAPINFRSAAHSRRRIECAAKRTVDLPAFPA